LFSVYRRIFNLHQTAGPLWTKDFDVDVLFDRRLALEIHRKSKSTRSTAYVRTQTLTLTECWVSLGLKALGTFVETLSPNGQHLKLGH
jgi:hypothetical protein